MSKNLMDDELEAIQKDLDSVLERLADYMNKDKLNAPGIYKNRERSGIKIDQFTFDEIAAIIVSYANQLDQVRGKALASDMAGLGHAIAYYYSDRINQWGKEDQLVNDFGQENGGIVAAISSLAAQTIPEEVNRNTLRDLAFQFMQGSSKWFGESHGFPLVRAKKKNESAKPPLILDGYIKKDLDKKMDAVELAYSKHLDGEPIDDLLFECVSEETGLKAATIKAAYYSPEGERRRELIAFIDAYKHGRVEWKNIERGTG